MKTGRGDWGREVEKQKDTKLAGGEGGRGGEGEVLGGREGDGGMEMKRDGVVGERGRERGKR